MNGNDVFQAGGVPRAGMLAGGWSMDNSMARQIGAQDESHRRLKALESAAVLDWVGDDARRALESEGYSYYVDTPAVSSDYATYGRDIIEAAAPGLNPVDFAGRYIAGLKDENKRGVYTQKMEKLKAEGAWEDGFCALVGEIFCDDVQTQYRTRKAEHEARMAAVARGREEMFARMGAELPRTIFEGAELSPELVSLLDRYDDTGKVLDALKQAQAAGEFAMRRARGGRSKEELEAAVEARVQELRQADAWSNSANAGWGVQVQRPDDELYQQARHEESSSYQFGMGRDFLADLVDRLTDEDGKLNELAMGALCQAMKMKAEGEQSLESKFCRNFFMAIARMQEQTMDEGERIMGGGIASSGVLPQVVPDQAPVIMTPEQQAEYETSYARRYSPNVEKLRSRIMQLEDTRLEASDKASWLAQGLSDIGTIAGSSAPYMAAGIVGGSLLSMMSTTNREVAQAYEEGASSPWMRGAIKGVSSAMGEGLFGAALGKVPGYSKLVDMLAMKAVSLPLAGKAVGRWQGSALGRFVGTLFSESAGELVVEELVADGFSWATINGLRRMGVPLDEETFKGLAERLQELDLTERQSVSTVAFCVVMGLTGVPAQLRAARDFAKNADLLMAAGIKEETAAGIMQAAQSGSFSDLEVNRLCVQAYQKEVLEDPIGARYRLRDEDKKLMSDIEADAMRRENVLVAALKEAGIVTMEAPDANGRHKVQILDAEKLEADKATWEKDKKGKLIRPEGYETPTKEVEFTGEQLAAYAQYHLSKRELNRMRSIRSQAFGKGARGNVSAGLQNVIALSELGAPALAQLAQSEGAMTLPVLKLLAGLASDALAEGRQLVQGVDNRALMRLPEDMERRLDEAVTLGEMTPAQAEAAKAGVSPVGASAVRVSGEDGMGRILINDGLTTTRGLAEDVLEKLLWEKAGGANGEAFMRQLAGEMASARAAIKAQTGEEVMPEFDPETVDVSTLTEIFSHFAQSAFYQTADKAGLKGDALTMAQLTDAALMAGTYAQAMQRAYPAFAESEAGREFAQRGGVLSDLMQEAGITLTSIYKEAEVTAENLAAVMEARAIARGGAEVSIEEVEQLAADVKAELGEAAQRTAEDLEPEESASDEVSTQELAEVFEQERSPLDEDGRIKPIPGAPVEVSEEGAGRGLKDGAFVRMGDGSVLGSARVEDIHLSPDVPRFTRGEAGAERGDRFRADEAGYLTVWRRMDGRLELISGQRRLSLAKADGVQDVAVRVYDEDAEHNAKWARLRNAELNIVDKSAGVEQVAYFFRETGMTDAGAEIRGLMPKKLDGEPMATMSMGKAIARQTPAGVFEDFMRGALTGEQAYFVATLGVADAAKAEAARMLMEGKNFDEVKAQMPGGGSTFSLALDNGVGAFQNAMDVREEVMERMLNSVKKAAQQWAAPFKGTADDRTKARGSTLGLMMGIYRRLPQGYKLQVAPILKRAAVLERMIATGKLSSHGQISKGARAELEDAVLDRLADEYPDLSDEMTAAPEAKAMARAKEKGIDALAKEFKKALPDSPERRSDLQVLIRDFLAEVDGMLGEIPGAMRDALTAAMNSPSTANVQKGFEVLQNHRQNRVSASAKREAWKKAMAEATEQVGREGMEGVYRELAAEVQRVMEQYLHAMEMARLGKMLEGFAPKVNPTTRKRVKGKYGAAFYKEVEVLQAIMGASAAERDAKTQELMDTLAPMNARMDELSPEEEAERERLDGELADWLTFGALGERGFRDVRTARRLLGDRAANARSFWEQRLNQTRGKLQAVMERHLSRADRVTETTLQREADQFRKMLEKAGAFANSFMSVSQLMYTLQAVPGLEKYALETVQAIAQGNINMMTRQAAQQQAMNEFLAKELGLDTEAKRNDFAVELKKKYRTGIMPDGDYITERKKFTIEEAEEWLAMTPEQREAYRQEWMENPDGRLKPLPEWATDALQIAYDENMTGDAAWARRKAAADARRLEGKPGTATRREHVPKPSFWVVASRREEAKEPLELSKDQALNLILLTEQPRYKDNAELYGFTEEVIGKLREFVGADALRFGYWMRDYMGSTGLAEVYEAREGVPFPAEENYWTGNFDLSAKMDTSQTAMDAGGMSVGGRYQMTKTRVRHNLTFDLSLGATNVFIGTMAMQNNYICMGDVTAEWRSLLANKRFARSLRANIGEARFSLLKEGIQVLDMQGLSEATAQRAASSIAERVQAALAASVLAAAPVTAAKQVSALAHATSVPGVTLGNLVPQLVADMCGKGRMTYGRMLREPAFAARMAHNESKYDVFTQLLTLGPDVTYSKLAAVNRFGMNILEWVDVRGNLASSVALYNLTWKRLERDNKAAGVTMTEEQMHRACMQQVDVMLDQAMMPTMKGQQALARVQGGLAAKCMFFMQGELMNKTGVMMREYHMRGGGVRGFMSSLKFVWSMSIAEQLIMTAVELIRGPSDDEELDWMWAIGHALTGLSGLGFLQSVPLAGELVADLVNGVVGMVTDGKARRVVRSNAYVRYLGLDVFSDWGRSYRYFSGLLDGKEMTVEEHVKAWQNMLRKAAGFSAWGGGVNSTFKWWSEASGTIQSANAILNAVRPVAEGAGFWAK